MPIFRLYNSKKKAMPDTVTVDGVAFDIRPSFKIILQILAMLQDKNIPDAEKLRLLGRWFYVSECPMGDIQVPFQEFINTLRFDYSQPFETDERRADDDGPQWDSDFDADEIYTSFLQQYGIDLFDVDMHWYKFMALLKGLGDDTAFVRRIRLRFMDLSHFKGAELAKMTQAKEAVQLPAKYTAEELDEIAEFEKMWG